MGKRVERDGEESMTPVVAKRQREIKKYDYKNNITDVRDLYESIDHQSHTGEVANDQLKLI